MITSIIEVDDNVNAETLNQIKDCAMRAVNKAFYKMYLDVPEQCCEIEKITFDYSYFIEGEDTYPMVNMIIKCKTHMDGDYEFTSEYDPEEDINYNAGFIMGMMRMHLKDFE